MQEEATKSKKASAVRRLRAFAVDFSLIMTINFALQSLVVKLSLLNSSSEDPLYSTNMSLFLLINSVFVLLLYIAYYVGFLRSPWRATIGKKILAIRVVNFSDQGRIKFHHAFVRLIVSQTPMLLFFILIIVINGIDYFNGENVRNNLILGGSASYYMLFAIIYYIAQAISIKRSPDNRSFADKLSGSVVISTK